MRKINPKSNNIDSFKYSLPISLHYYDISYHREKKTKLDAYANNYNFTNINPPDFEINNPNVSLMVYDEDGNTLYISNNNSGAIAKIVKINSCRYAAIKSQKNKYHRLNEILKSFSHKELKEYILK